MDLRPGDQLMAIDFAIVSTISKVSSTAHHIMPVYDSRTLPGETVDFPMVSPRRPSSLLWSVQHKHGWAQDYCLRQKQHA